MTDFEELGIRELKPQGKQAQKIIDESSPGAMLKADIKGFFGKVTGAIKEHYSPENVAARRKDRIARQKDQLEDLRMQNQLNRERMKRDRLMEERMPPMGAFQGQFPPMVDNGDYGWQRRPRSRRR